MYEEYAIMFKSLSDGNRLKILEMLVKGETCGCTLIDKLTIKQPTLSYHLKMLTDSGLTKTLKEGVMVKHQVNKEKINDMIRFLTDLLNATEVCAS